jgi:type IV pilus assembly protein PilP
MMRAPIRISLSLTTLLLLSACAESGTEEIRQWMKEVEKDTKVSVTPLSPPKKYIPFVYAARESVDPFSSNKLAIAFAKLQANSGPGLKPDLDRRREPLEAYPLDALKMVGTIQKPGITYALVQADKGVFQVKIGNYMGQNLGMITNITEDGIDLKEVVQDAAGEWVERAAKLELQGSGK